MTRKALHPPCLQGRVAPRRSECQDGAALVATRPDDCRRPAYDLSVDLLARMESMRSPAWPAAARAAPRRPFWRSRASFATALPDVELLYIGDPRRPGSDARRRGRHPLRRHLDGKAPPLLGHPERDRPGSDRARHRPVACSSPPFRARRRDGRRRLRQRAATRGCRPAPDAGPDPPAGRHSRPGEPPARALRNTDHRCAARRRSAAFPPGRTVLRGNPVRRRIFEGHADEAVRLLGLEPGVPLVVATGGGTGALGLNRIVAAAAPLLVERCQIVHLTGRGRGVPTTDLGGRYRQTEFLVDEMPTCSPPPTLWSPGPGSAL